MSKIRLRRVFFALFMLMSVLFLCTGCVKRTSSGGRGTAGLNKKTEETTTEVETTVNRANAQDMFIVTGINLMESKVTLTNMSDGSIQVLSYSGGTSIQNRFGTEILMQDVALGEIVDVSYISGTQKLISMKESEAAWENTTVTNWSVDYEKQMIRIGSEQFSYGKDLKIFSGAEEIDIHELHIIDALIVKGIDKKIYSISVSTGHGYVKIINETNMIGGLVEIGTDIMTAITEDMIIVAPEGSYTLTASKEGVGGSKEIHVMRGKETIVSISEFQGELKRQGSLRLNVIPEGVQFSVFIDGKPVDINNDIELSYGVHRIVITSDKYVDYEESVIISSVYTNKTIDLSVDEEEETTGKETETGSQEEETTTVGSEEETTETSGNESEMEVTLTKTYNNLVVISGPEDAEVYLDGVSIGTAPMTFAKKSGQHIFVLRQDGYETEAYTYIFDSTTEDVYIKFPEMKESESK